MGTPDTTRPERSTHAPLVRFPSRKRRRESAAIASRNLVLISAGTGVPALQAAESPTLLMLAVEDLCWQLAVAESETRRPAVWHRAARAAWAHEQARLSDKRKRLAAMAREAINEL
jgi:hypothetical protein